ncbi:phenylacetaldehyde reductase-like [Humulus lupulus]|uniref:phenylacetaldehyde reductase-like n=1 Tax=Humulus lupulus TaxID=3486 RepID=UPI002B40F06E|nr:phenylacetaldehyde reductase-like [Humulus lupulus]
MSREGKVVCVSGASGYIASWLVKLLLQYGYNVKGSVRDLNYSNKIEHLVALDGAKERLHLFKENLMEKGSFDSAINGCDGVFHTAFPVLLHSVIDPQAELIEPAVKGTLNVLRSCAKAQSVKRVVVTSSLASVLYNGKELTSDVVVDETWFSDPIVCENMKNFYAVSKILAKEAGWKFANENGIYLVTIHPGLVLGPLLQQTINSSVKRITKLVNGPQMFPNLVYACVDVRDVAKAHIQAFETASASGRYCLAACVAHIYEFLKILKQLYPALTIPEKCEDDLPLKPNSQVSNVKAKSLGIDFIPLEVSLRDIVESLKEKGLFNI